MELAETHTGKRWLVLWADTVETRAVGIDFLGEHAGESAEVFVIPQVADLDRSGQSKVRQ